MATQFAPPSSRRLRVLLLAVAFCLAVDSEAAFSSPSPDALWRRTATLFHAVEPQFHNLYNPIKKLPPLSSTDAAYAGYERAAQAAEEYLATRQTNSYRTALALYFAAMSYSRIQQHEKALHFIGRLLQEFPDFKRARVPNFPRIDRPIQSDLLQLKLWHLSQLPKPLQSQKPLDALRAASQAGATAIISRPAPASDGVDYSSPTEDQLRVAALPDVPTLVAQLHDELLPQAIKTEGAKSVRDYLRGLNNGPFASYALHKLMEVDRVVLAEYSAQAKKALRARKFDDAKTIYRRIIAEYSGTEAARLAEADLQQATIAEYKYVAQVALKKNRFDDAKKAYRALIAAYPGDAEARWAEDALKKIVPVAVNYYKIQGDEHFHPEARSQFHVPQSKARAFYQKMYEEEPDGAQADYALYQWSRALGTEGKLKAALQQLQELQKKFPHSEELPASLFLQGFYYGSQKPPRYDKAIEVFNHIIEKYPQSKEAPEALWYGAFFLAWSNRFPAAQERLQKLNEAYPDSPRHKWAAPWMKRFQEKINSGGQWP